MRLLLEQGADPLIAADDGLRALDKSASEAVRALLRDPPPAAAEAGDDGAARRRWEKLERIQRETLEADKRREEAAAKRIPAIMREAPAPPVMPAGRAEAAPNAV